MRSNARVAAVALALASLSTGCGSGAVTPATTPSTSASTATPAAKSDYTSLLSKPSDLPRIAGVSWTAAPPKVIPPDPPGVTQTYTSGSDAINTSIAVTTDAAGAVAFLGGSADGVTSEVTGGAKVQLPAVSSDATFTSGTSANGKAAEAALLFTVQNTAVIMIFTGPLDEPVPQDFAEAAGKVQVSTIQAALPGLK